MPRFHFHTEDGQFLIDEEGIELDGIDDAKTAAIQTLCDVLGANPDKYWAHQHFAVIVTDDDRNVLFALNLEPEIPRLLH